MLQVAVLGIVGPPVALLLGGNSFYYNYLVQGRDPAVVMRAWLWLVYAMFVLAVLYRGLLRNRLLAYAGKPVEHQTHTRYFRFWCLSIGAALACIFVLFAQNGFSDPWLSAASLNAQEFSARRIELAGSVNMVVFDVGLHIFIAFAMVTAFFFIKRPFVSLVTLVVFAALLTFNLAKSPVADTLMQLAMIYLLLRRASWKPVIFLFFGAAALGLLMFVISKTDFTGVFEGFSARLFLGEFSDLPSYFRVFHNESVSLAAALPGYIQSLFHLHETDPARAVMVYITKAKNMDKAGVANTFFIGSAYAYLGDIGALLAPFLVFANFYLVTRIFTALRKNVFSVFMLGYLIYRLSNGFWSDIGYFLFSGIQISVIIFLLIKLFFDARKAKLAHGG